MIPGPSGGCLERMFLLDYALDTHRIDSRNQTHTYILRLRYICFLKSDHQYEARKFYLISEPKFSTFYLVSEYKRLNIIYEFLALHDFNIY